MFERQWMKRDFQKYAKLPMEQVLDQLQQLESTLHEETDGPLPGGELPPRLAGYFAHYQEMATGYLKDPQVRAEQTKIIGDWKTSAEALAKILHCN